MGGDGVMVGVMVGGVGVKVGVMVGGDGDGFLSLSLPQ